MATAIQPNGPPATILPEDNANMNGHQNLMHSGSQASDSVVMPSAATSKSAKKSKAKKGADPNETGKLLAAKINQLELDAAGEKDQEQEIGMLHVLC